MHLFIAALMMGFITTFLTQFITKCARLQEDASIGLVFTTLFAIGIVLVTLFTRNAHIGTEIITGNVDALHIDDLKNVFLIAMLNIVTACLFYRGFLLTTFDVGFSKSIGISSSFYHYLLMMQTAITVLGAFRTVGVFLVLSLLVGPVIIARAITHDLKKLMILSICIGIFLSILSIALMRHIFSAYHLALSTSGLLITLIFLSYLVTIFVSRLRMVLLHKIKKRYHLSDAV
jgi:manganese/zinc/iron transport system permease protein